MSVNDKYYEVLPLIKKFKTRESYIDGMLYDLFSEEPEENLEQLISDLEKIYDVYWMPISLIRRRTGLYQNDFARKFYINPSTYRQWESERRPIPLSTKFLIAEILGLLPK